MFSNVIKRDWGSEEDILNYKKKLITPDSRQLQVWLACMEFSALSEFLSHTAVPSARVWVSEVHVPTELTWRVFWIARVTPMVPEIHYLNWGGCLWISETQDVFPDGKNVGFRNQHFVSSLTWVVVGIIKKIVHHLLLKKENGLWCLGSIEI